MVKPPLRTKSIGFKVSVVLAFGTKLPCGIWRGQSGHAFHMGFTCPPACSL